MPTSVDLSRTPAGRAIRREVRGAVKAGSRGPWIVGFSGGPDSLALAAALAAAAREQNDPSLEIHLVHVDHGLDAGSSWRAAAAQALAGNLQLPFTLLERSVPAERRRGENLEAAARRVRYQALEEVRHELGADRILTAHHLDDQIETTMLRLRSGTGLLGLRGIQERRGALWRPLLALRRSELADLLASTDLVPLRDPGNDDLARDRNRLRHRTLPNLLAGTPDLHETLAALACRAASWRPAFEARLVNAVQLESSNTTASLVVQDLLDLPSLPALLALQVLENAAGRRPPTSTKSKRELLRKVATMSPAATGRALGGGWKLASGRLVLSSEAAPRPAEVPPISYTVGVPGEVEIPELGGRMRLEMKAVEEWMYHGSRHRAALRIPEPPPAWLEVRNRRPGDRLRPLGAPGMRRLKDLLIDRKVPREERDRIPLLVLDGAIAWVPGITIAEEFRLRDDREVLVAEWIGNPGSQSRRSPSRGAPDARPEEGRN